MLKELLQKLEKEMLMVNHIQAHLLNKEMETFNNKKDHFKIKELNMLEEFLLII